MFSELTAWVMGDVPHGLACPQAVHLCLSHHEHLPMNHEAQIHPAGENLLSHLQSHWGRCSPVVQQWLMVPLSLSSVLSSTQTGWAMVML